MYQEMRVTIPVELLQLIDQAAATREQTRSEVVIEAMYKNNDKAKNWTARLCKTAGCTKSAERKNGGRMGRCGHHYEEEFGIPAKYGTK
jgi:metal-responsive CopG/Arc/MetJ family transcriptional regulator